MYDLILKDHIETAHRSMTYFSPQIQNELIYCCELEIRDQIVSKYKESQFCKISRFRFILSSYALLNDEYILGLVPSHTAANCVDFSTASLCDTLSSCMFW
jgi:hypothetical protein